MIKENNKCAHVWLGVGIWDGKDDEGKPTGGILYKCEKCSEKATGLRSIKEKGGTVDLERSKYKARGSEEFLNK